MKRVREVFLYSDEDEVSDDRATGLPVDTRRSGKEASTVGDFVSDGWRTTKTTKEASDDSYQEINAKLVPNLEKVNCDNACIESSEAYSLDWEEDTVGEGMQNRSRSTSNSKRGMRVQVVKADNGFQATQLSFQVSMEKQAKNHGKYKKWLEQENFVRQTLGSLNLVTVQSSIGSTPSCLAESKKLSKPKELRGGEENVEEDNENALVTCLPSSSRIKPIIDEATGKIRAVETLGGYCLTVDERELMDVHEDVESKRKDKTNEIGMLEKEEESRDCEEEDDDDDDDDEEERRMDALVTVAVAQHLVNCFQDPEVLKDLEAPLRDASRPFLDEVLPLFQQRERCIRRGQEDDEDDEKDTEEGNKEALCKQEWREGEEKHAPSSSHNTISDGTPLHKSGYSTSSRALCFLIPPVKDVPHPHSPSAQSQEKVIWRDKEGESTQITRCERRATSPMDDGSISQPLEKTVYSSSLLKLSHNTDDKVHSSTDITTEVQGNDKLLSSSSSDKGNNDDLQHSGLFPPKYRINSIKVDHNYRSEIEVHHLDDDEVFARAVEQPLKRILAIYRRLNRPPKPENVVINGVVMDF